MPCDTMDCTLYVTGYTKTMPITQKLNFSNEQKYLTFRKFKMAKILSLDSRLPLCYLKVLQRISIKLGRHAFLPSESIQGTFFSHN